MASLAMDMLPQLVRRVKGIDCTEIGPDCPLSGTIYGYRPSLAWNALFLAIFGLSTAVHAFQGARYKTWSFLVAMVVGGLCESVGEIGRLMMHHNPYSDSGFKLQIVLLTFAPAFLAAGIYLQLKHLILTFGASWSLIRPNLYTWIFISCDIFSIALQGAGGGIAASVEPTDSIFAVGNHLTIAGLSFQVLTLLLFGILAAEYALRVLKHKHELNPDTEALRRTLRFRLFLVAIGVAYITILIRCVYRVAELAGGWSESNHVLSNEALFTALDSFMIAIAMIAFNLFHPGRCLQFKQMNGGVAGKREVESDLEVRAAAK